MGFFSHNIPNYSSMWYWLLPRGSHEPCNINLHTATGNNYQQPSAFWSDFAKIQRKWFYLFPWSSVGNISQLDQPFKHQDPFKGGITLKVKPAISHSIFPRSFITYFFITVVLAGAMLESYIDVGQKNKSPIIPPARNHPHSHVGKFSSKLCPICCAIS